MPDFDDTAAMYSYMQQFDTSERENAALTDARQQSSAPAAMILTTQNQETSTSTSSQRNLILKSTAENEKGGRRVISNINRDKMPMAIQDTTLASDAFGEGSSGAHQSSKQAHNAKERLRRMNLNASYSTLRYLLPNSKRSKKRWSAPKIIGKALTYIPELQNEIARLENLEKEIKRALSNQNPNSNNVTANTSLNITEVAEGELIIQFCARRDKGGVLSGLIRRVEDEGMSVKGASSVVVISDGRVCCHLHIEIESVLTSSDYIAVLRDQLGSWLD